MKAIANLKKPVLLQAFGNPVQDVLEMVLLGESAARKSTYSLSSQSDFSNVIDS